jgi:ELWxxDGT repeat protein
MTNKKLLAAMLLFSFNSLALEQQSSEEFSFSQASFENNSSQNNSTSQYSNFHSDGENVIFTYTNEHSGKGNELGVYTPRMNAFFLPDLNHSSGSKLSNFMEFNGMVYFSAIDIHKGRELYYVDPKSKKAVLFDINPNGSSLRETEDGGKIYQHRPYFPKQYKAFKNHLYFVANNGSHGYELWALDSNNAPVMIKDIYTGASSSNPRYFSVTDEYLYFITDAQNGHNLIRLHGDTQQTEIIATYPEISHLTTAVDDAFFVAKGEQGVEVLYQFETESNTVVAVTDPSTNLMNTFSNFDSLIAVKNSVYFNAKSSSFNLNYNPIAFWLFDLDTLVVKKFGADAISEAEVLGVFNNKLFFAQKDWSQYRNMLFLASNKNAKYLDYYALSDTQAGFEVDHVKQHQDEIYYSIRGPSGINILAKVSLITNELTEFTHLETPSYPSRGAIEAFSSFAFVNDTIYYPIYGFSGDGELKHYFESYNVNTSELKTLKLAELLHTGLIANSDLVSLNVNENIQIDVLANDTDPQGASLTITAATAISGTVEIVEDKLVYTAKTDFFGTDLITYTIENEYGLSANAEVQVTVVVVAPIANADTASLSANSDVQIDVLVNDTDPQNALLTITAATATLGTVEIVEGKLHYTAKTNFVGADVITYTIKNEYGLSASAEVQVTVKAIEEPVTEKKKSSGSLYFILLMMCLLVLLNKGGVLAFHRR